MVFFWKTTLTPWRLTNGILDSHRVHGPREPLDTFLDLFRLGMAVAQANVVRRRSQPLRAVAGVELAAGNNSDLLLESARRELVGVDVLAAASARGNSRPAGP